VRKSHFKMCEILQRRQFKRFFNLNQKTKYLREAKIPFIKLRSFARFAFLHLPKKNLIPLKSQIYLSNQLPSHSLIFQNMFLSVEK
jgi:hypothetical protein